MLTVVYSLIDFPPSGFHTTQSHASSLPHANVSSYTLRVLSSCARYPLAWPTNVLSLPWRTASHLVCVADAQGLPFSISSHTQRPQLPWCCPFIWHRRSTLLCFSISTQNIGKLWHKTAWLLPVNDWWCLVSNIGSLGESVRDPPPNPKLCFTLIPLCRVLHYWRTKPLFVLVHLEGMQKAMTKQPLEWVVSYPLFIVTTQEVVYDCKSSRFKKPSSL